MNGIVLDQHYTDSLLRLCSPRGTYRPFSRLSRALPRQDVLLSLVLFGHAFLQPPYWLDNYDRSVLRRLESEELITFIDSAAYVPAFAELGRLLDKAFELDVIVEHLDVPDVSPRAHLVLPMTEYEGNHLEYSEARKDLQLLLRRYLYVDPLVTSTAAHLGERGYDSTDIPEFSRCTGLLSGIDGTDEGLSSFWTLVGTFLSTKNPYELVELALPNRAARLCTSRRKALEYADSVTGGAKLLASAIAVHGSQSFASHHGLAIKTASSGRGGAIDRSVGQEAYQLFKIQFKNLRYPVLETVDDALRLRDDPNLASYRAVIDEYTTLLRGAPPANRLRLLTHFKEQITKASAEFKTHSSQLRKVETFSFWLSFPLILLGLATGLPIDDIALVPASLYARLKSRRNLREFGWVAFGRSE